MTPDMPSDREGEDRAAEGASVVAPRMDRIPIAVGVMIFWVIVLGAPPVVGLSTLDSLLVGALLVGVPAVAFAQRGLLSSVPLERVPLYWGSIVTLWLLGSASWLVGTREAGAVAVGLTAVGPGSFVAWSAGLTAVALVAVWIFRWLARALDVPDPRFLRRLMPVTGPERRVFALLSTSAGVCEELAYRGYLIGVLTPAVGSSAAVGVSSFCFGLVHVYQGPLGMVRAGVIGAVFALGFLLSGSILPAVLAHAAVDLVAGLVIGERLLSHEPANGVEPEDRSR